MRKLDFGKPPQSDRIVGFTIPTAGTFYVCDHDGVWKVKLEATPITELTNETPYEFVERRADFLGLVFEGLNANDPIVRVRQNQIAYDFDPEKDFVTLNYEVAGRSGQIEFRTLSGDWFAASFSDDGKYLVLADPHDIALYEVC
jgi:hypothetical protein